MKFEDYLSKDEIKKTMENAPAGESQFWRIPTGKSKVRLLPRKNSKVPWMTTYTHRNGVDNQIGTCLRTFGERNCPICKKSWALHESELKEDKKLGLEVMKSPRHLFNVYIVNDESNLELNGTVKILSVGKKLYELITETFDEIGLDIFNPEDGYDLIINKKTIGGSDYPDYTSSKFSNEKSFVGKMSDLADRLIEIDPLISKDSVEDLKKKFAFLFTAAELAGIDISAQKSNSDNEDEEAEDVNDSEEVDSISDDDLDEDLEDMLKEIE